MTDQQSPSRPGATGNLALLGMIAFLTAGPAAQGLADVARRGAPRGPAPAGRSYTNADLKPADPIGPVPPPAAASEPVHGAEAAPSETTEKPSVTSVTTAPVTGAPGGAGRGPLSDEEFKAAEERRMTSERKLAEELAARMRQRQERVLGLKKELQELQQAHAAGKPGATEAARNATQESLSEAERELASAQRAVSRAEAQSKQATVRTAPPAKP